MKLTKKFYMAIKFLKNLVGKIQGNTLSYLFVIFCAFLPFQFALNPAPGYDLAVIRIIIPLMFAGWFIFQVKSRSFFIINNKKTYLLVIFLLLATVSISFSSNLFWSLRKLLFLLSIFPIYFVAISAFKTKKMQRNAVSALVIGATLLSIASLIQFFCQFIFGIDPVYNFLAAHISPFFLGNSFSQTVLAYPSWLVNSGGATYMRAVANFPDPHMLAYYLGMLVPWAVALGATSQKKSEWFFVSAIFIVAADICTFTRGGYIALIAGSFVILPLVSRSSKKKIIAAAAILLVFFVIAPQSPVAGRLASSFNIQEGSNQGRISNWQQAIIIIRNHPLGVGIGMYSLAVDPNADYREPIYAHDLYLDIAAELGILTTIIFVVILFVSFASFWESAKVEPFFVAGVARITYILFKFCHFF